MKLHDLKKQHAHALNKMESIVQAAEAAGRELTTSESADFEMSERAANALHLEIKKNGKAVNTPFQVFRARDHTR